jgi:hypothetical protein
MALRYPAYKGAVCSKIRENIIFMEVRAIMPYLEGIGFKDRNLGGISPKPTGPQNHFLSTAAKLAA